MGDVDPLANAAHPTTVQRSTGAHYIDVPHYGGILVGSVVLFVTGFAMLIPATALMVSGLLQPTTSANHYLDGLTRIVAGMLTFGYAAILWLFGSVALAVRDIARNSFDPGMQTRPGPILLLSSGQRLPSRRSPERDVHGTAGATENTPEGQEGHSWDTRASWHVFFTIAFDLLGSTGAPLASP